MNIKNFLLLILLLSQFNYQSYAAVDIKKHVQIEQQSKINHFQKSTKSSSSWLQKRKSRIRDFFKIKKKKNTSTQNLDQKKEIPFIVTLSAMFSSAGTVIILFVLALSRWYSISFPFLILPLLTFGFVAAIILGSLGLKKIKSDQDKYEGKRLAWIGILLSIIWLFISLSIYILLF